MLKQPEVYETPLGRLRSLTETIDSRIGGLERASPSDAIVLLNQLDQAQTLYAGLAENGVDLRAEDGRRETIRLTLQRKAGKMLNLLRAEGGLANLRAPLNPGHERWWWYLDEYEAEQRQKDIRNLLRGAIIVAVVVGIVYVLFHTVLRADPIAVAHLRDLQQIQIAIQNNDLNAALQAADNGLVEFPDDGELLLWRGTVLTLLHRDQEAAADFAAARPQYPDDATYLIERSNIRQQAGDLAGALADAQAAVAAAPNSAQAYLALGVANDQLGDVPAAAQAYQTAADLAAQSNDAQLEAMAKVQLAMLLQRGGSLPPPEASPQATP
jgi:tetratricopeptide (TPR) repeat protein